MRPWLLPAIGLAVAALLAASRVPALGLGLHAGFVLASAAPVGSVLLCAIARLTGAEWPAVTPRVPALWWMTALGALAMLAATGVALPPHLALWAHPLAQAARAAVALGALAWAGARLAGGAGPTFAGVTLAVYAWVVTPVAADWLLPADPGHPVSAVGMMLFLLQFSAGCAVAIPGADGRQRRDLALLLVAGLLGLCYLAFMDYLIVWFGNLPTRVPFYLDRPGWLAAAALLVGLGGTLAAVVAGRDGPAAPTAGIGLTLFVLWWIGGGPIAALVAVATAGLATWGERARG